MNNNIKSPRGVYYDLSKSPYIFIDRQANIFRFSSQKKLNMFNTKVLIEEAKYIKYASKLKQYGYNIELGLVEARKVIPSLVYSKMLYK